MLATKTTVSETTSDHPTAVRALQWAESWYDPSDRADREALIRRARTEVFDAEASGEAVGG